MAQQLIQEQTLKQQLQQRLSAQQLQIVKLIEMPINELEQNIAAEIDDNPALETNDGGSDYDGTNDYDDSNNGNDTDESFDMANEREERKDALDSALENIGRDDQMPEPTDYQPSSADNNDYRRMDYADTTSFLDKLNEQMADHDLTAKQQYIMEYLIGSLDSDGLLRKDSDTLSDELAIYHNIDATAEEIDNVVAVLQEFDPPGIGAHDLQECLLLQLDRSTATDPRIMAHEVIEQHFQLFIHKKWDKIQQAMNLTDNQLSEVRHEITRLNPKPGASMNETQNHATQQITPDFIVETLDDGNISMTLNQGNVPELNVSPSFVSMVETYRDNKDSLNRQQKEALLYAKDKVTKAQTYIDAIKQRQHTLTVTMKAIIKWQQDFFREGDESLLKPMRLKDIATKTGLDISTVSRVSNQKYVQTRWGMFPLKFFFNDKYTDNQGNTISTRTMKIALKEIVDDEDKAHPLTDTALSEAMKQKGFPLARRTVVKYREQMGIPNAKMRKQ
jgi:RNA polymerase sigma-54 factor